MEDTIQEDKSGIELRTCTTKHLLGELIKIPSASDTLHYGARRWCFAVETDGAERVLTRNDGQAGKSANGWDLLHRAWYLRGAFALDRRRWRNSVHFSC